ncbi:MAG: 50S ribosomal protein L24 [Bacteroidales bacterium]|nr:50S ribosomal protein L24 [Bacteroidales bacterium]MCF8403841.1 50S ribosomal protein L24 [Bacteroidales bacterium]
MRKKLHIKKGDNVMVISGNYKGQQGKVLFVDVEKSRAIVEGINMVSKHTKPNAENPKGGIVQKEGTIHASNLKLVDGSGKPTRIGKRLDDKTNKSVRYSKKTGEVIK